MAETGEGGGASIRIARLVEGWTLRRAHEVVAIHETMATRMTTSLNVDRERVTVIANWSHVTPSALDPSAARARLGWEDVFTVLHAGNMGRKQGLENVVEAARLADAQGVPVRIVLLGDGSERADLERLASACPTLAFEDPVAEDDFPTALAAADALLLNEAPSVREMAVPSKLTSYFAAARPVVFAVEPEGVVAGLAKAAGAGITVRSGDPAALLGAVRELSADSHMRERLGKSAVEYWTERFSPEQALAQWERLVRHHPKTRSSAS
jgi:glycosyltransferase involved in cell wall biosynthesis